MLMFSATMPDEIRSLADEFLHRPVTVELGASRPVEKLLDGVHLPEGFTLLSGPAGSDKTILLSEFIARLEQPVAWLSLEDAVPTILINDLTTQDQSIVLVLDDYHPIHNPSIHTGLLFLLEHLPGNLNIVVSTRADPPWPLACFRVRNQLIEIRSLDLRFSVEEAAEFLTRTLGLNLSAEDVTALDERTEGWRLACS
jgi:LuxR family transcriptional regulator, maltose regulon positive regulatory protein